MRQMTAEYFGPDHQSNLAATYAEFGQLDESIELVKEILEKRNELLGSNDSTTKTTAHRLVKLCRKA